jgi:hypothetical protein
MALEPAVKNRTSGDPEQENATTAPTARQTKSLLVALMVLTFNTGLIDVVSYIGLGRVFVANMTGNVVLLAFGRGNRRKTRYQPGSGQ